MCRTDSGKQVQTVMVMSLWLELCSESTLFVERDIRSFPEVEPLATDGTQISLLASGPSRYKETIMNLQTIDIFTRKLGPVSALIDMVMEAVLPKCVFR